MDAFMKFTGGLERVSSKLYLDRVCSMPHSGDAPGVSNSGETVMLP